MYDVDSLIEDAELLEPLRRSVVAGEPPAYLRSLKLKITARCNLRCVMCRYGRGLSLPELPSARWRSLLSEAAALGCRKVHFSGGEVLVRSDFEELAAHAADERMKVTFTSNLTLMTHERAKALMRHKVSSISTSLDGATAATHDRIRGIKGSFRRTIRALESLSRERERRSRRTRLRINFVMMRRNFAEYPALLRLAHELGATDVVPMPVDSKRTDLRLSKQMIRRYNCEIAPEVERLRRVAGWSVEDAYVFPFGRSSQGIHEAVAGRYAGGFYRDHLCYAPFLHMFVAWDGKAYLCCMTNGRIEPLGELAHQSVAEVFGGRAFQALRAAMIHERLPSCHQCDMFTAANRRLAEVLPATHANPVSRRSLPIL
jgi:MoaA/NifB/PqqE/SkfB family radical SAM enzyme